MKRPTAATSKLLCLSLLVIAPTLAAKAEGPAATTPPARSDRAATGPAADKCLANLSAFDAQMVKDGYWLGGSGYDYGYPLGGYSYGHGYPVGPYAAVASGYRNARPGYEVRILVVAANILARRGQQQSCEDVLETTRAVYSTYMEEMSSDGMPAADVFSWRQQQISVSTPVTSMTTSFRSDQLLGTAVRTQKDEALGSVNDFILNPQTGKIAYLVVGRGGIFTIGEKYFPIPWEDFKGSPSMNLLVLDTEPRIVDAAPQAAKGRFTTPGQDSVAVDAYWKAQFVGKP
jgi:sporulation protein YlmC with PRC-barrel domain